MLNILQMRLAMARTTDKDIGNWVHISSALSKTLGDLAKTIAERNQPKIVTQDDEGPDDQ